MQQKRGARDQAFAFRDTVIGSHHLSEHFADTGMPAFEPACQPCRHAYWRERCIDFGGYSNPHGTFRRYIRRYQREQIILRCATVSDLTTIQDAMKSVAQVGLTALRISRQLETYLL
jgi:hypothetical protein